MDLSDCEALIRQGKFDSAREFLRATNLAKISRTEALQFANYARRSQLYTLAIRALWPIVRAENIKLTKPTDMESAEYAVSLLRLGAVHEAKQLLLASAHRGHAESHLYLAWCHFNQWEYAQALPFLQTYVALPDLPDYSRIVGKVNLASTFVFLRKLEAADQLLGEIRAYTKQNNLTLLYGNCLELSAQAAMESRNFNLAEEHLDEAWGLFKETQSFARLFLSKWRAKLHLERGNYEIGFSELEKVRKEAQAHRVYETLREVDRLRAYFSKDRALALKVYWGTPYPEYRNFFIEKEILKPTDVDQDYHYLQKSSQIIDLKQAILNSDDGKNKQILDSGRVSHRLLMILANDFYKPHSLGSIFSNLFFEEFYEPITSPNRIYQQIHRLKKEMSGLIQVNEVKGKYSVVPQANCCFKFDSHDRETHIHSREQVIWNEIHQTFGHKSFRTQELKQSLGISQSSATRILRWALKNGRANKVSAGPHTQYQCEIKKKVS